MAPGIVAMRKSFNVGTPLCIWPGDRPALSRMPASCDGLMTPRNRIVTVACRSRLSRPRRAIDRPSGQSSPSLRGRQDLSDCRRLCLRIGNSVVAPASGGSLLCAGVGLSGCRISTQKVPKQQVSAFPITAGTTDVDLDVARPASEWAEEAVLIVTAPKLHSELFDGGDVAELVQ